MLQAGQHPNFLDESQFASLGGWIGVQNLQCHLALEPGVFGEIDGSEGSLSDLAPNFVSSSERGPERADRVVGSGRARHADSSSGALGSGPGALASRLLHEFAMTPTDGARQT